MSLAFIKRLTTVFAGTPWDYRVSVLRDLFGAALMYPYNKLTVGAIGRGTILYAGIRFYGRGNISFARHVTVHTGTKFVARERESRIRIGPHSVIHRFCELNAFEGFIVVGDNCTINQGCAVYGNGGVTIGSDVRVATGTVIAASNHVFANATIPICQQGMSALGIKIGDDVWIGARCCILDGVTVGNGCVIGAGAVVTRDLPPLSVAAGVPARVIAKRGERMHFAL